MLMPNIIDISCVSYEDLQSVSNEAPSGCSLSSTVERFFLSQTHTDTMVQSVCVCVCVSLVRRRLTAARAFRAARLCVIIEVMLFKKHSGAERETGRRRDRPQSGALLQRARQRRGGDDQKRRMETCALTNKHPMNEHSDPDENYHMIPVCFHVSVHLVSAFREISEAKKCFGTNYRHLITTFHSFTSQWMLWEDPEFCQRNSPSHQTEKLYNHLTAEYLTYSDENESILSSSRWWKSDHLVK